MTDPVNEARKKLMEALGDKDKEYLNLMKMWFKMKLSKEEFDSETRKFLTQEQIHLHNQLLLHLLNKCVGLSKPTSFSNDRSSVPRKYTYTQGTFEPLDPTMYVVTERQDINVDAPQFLVHERLLPDQSFMLARMMYGAWELGLEGSSPEAADLLVVATHHFLKNIITAVICHRKGFQLDKNFIHGIGSPIPNPWLRNVFNNRYEEKFQSLKCDPGENCILVPTERPTEEYLEHEAAFRLAASDCDDNLLPISLVDLITTLKVYPNIIASNFIHTVNSERIIARITHPSWDD